MGQPGDSNTLLLDQAERWQRGQPLPVETYFARYPDVAANPEAALDLIYNEIFLREQHGESPRLDEYVQRFPQYAEQLRLQFEVHEAFGEEPRSATVEQGLPAPGAAGGPQEPTLPDGQVPGYEILDELGRGGMGVVYKARQRGLNRLVALKMILAGSQASPRERARFRTEAEAVARLRHPNIIPIYEVNEHDGQLYFSLELAEGGNLSQKIAGAPQAPAAAAELVETLGRAIHHAHQHGIIHRDLKPSNILLVSGGVVSGEWSEGGPTRHSPLTTHHSPLTPKITDFGLAKLLDAEVSQTGTDGFVGTPSYMAPEQAAGKSREVGPAVDVYALGAILYELLIGQPPFRGATLLETLEQVRSQEPVPPRRRLPKLPRDLETICLKCLEKDPRRRYSTAEALADDLCRFLAGEPIWARPTPVWQHGVKWVRRRPAVAGLIGVTLAGALTPVGLLVWHNVDLRAKVDRALVDQQERIRLESAGQNAEARFRTFLRKHDEALLQGLYAMHVQGPDMPANPETVRAAAEAALAEVTNPDGTVALSPYWDPEQTEEVRTGCYELLLILAETAAGPASARTAADRPRVLQALGYLDRARAITSPTWVYHLRRAGYLGRLGDAPGAARERDAAGEPSAAADYFLLGVEHYQKGELKAAVQDFDRTLGRKADHFWAQYFRAMAHLQLGRYAEAEVGLTACLGRKPDFVWTYLMRGFAASELGKLPAAEADFHKAEQFHPDGVARYALYVNRAALRLKQRREAEAADDLRRAVDLMPEQYRAYLYLALLAKERMDYAGALRHLEQAVALCPPGPGLADLHRQRAELLYRAGKYREAVAACDRALQLQPDRPEVHGLRGQALLKLREYGPAVQALTAYIDSGAPPHAEVYRRRGEAYTQLGNHRAALQDYTVALALAPDATVYDHRGWAYFFCDAWQPALTDFEEALRRDANHPDARVGRALARVMLGDYRQATAEAEEALRREPASPDMVHNLACVFALAAGRARSDRAAADGPALAARYQARSVEVLRRALALVPRDGRRNFWREKMAPDSALDPVRQSPAFAELAREYGGAPPQ
jgi:serine/threonine protein kinase/tetratricopeptide (TPR) repeat protein